MTYAPGALIQSQDLNIIQGASRSDQPYASDAVAENQLSALWGVGFGDRGYGQTVPVMVPVESGTPVTSAQWQSLSNVVTNMSSHTQTVITGIPSFEQLASGSLIQASGFDWTPVAALLDANRFQVNGALMRLIGGVTSTRNSSWTDSVIHEFWADFGSEDAARFFFNHGGEVVLRPRLQGAPDAHSQSWATMFELLDAVRFQIRGTTQTGTGGTGSSIGYYDLLNEYQTVFEQFDTGSYAQNYMRVQARRSQFLGINGGNGSRLEFLVTFDDVFGGPGDPVQGTLTHEILSFVANGSSLTVGAPVYNTTQGLDGGGGIPYYYFTDQITTVVEEYNVLASAQAAGYDASVAPLYATVIVRPGGVIRGISNTFPAFDVPEMSDPQTEVILVVDAGGAIVGAGGAGGTGAPSGVCGCPPGEPGGSGGPAIRLQHATTIINNGVIGGGGGGGGGGGVACGSTTNTAGGGGGGGAGFGTGGAVNPCGVTIPNLGGEGEPGQLITGGSPTFVNNPLLALVVMPGGRGGDLGLPGLPGGSGLTWTSQYSAGGSGGAAGAGIINSIFVQEGSSLGDLRGQTI
jgi:hypothetical protein